LRYFQEKMKGLKPTTTIVTLPNPLSRVIASEEWCCSFFRGCKSAIKEKTSSILFIVADSQSVSTRLRFNDLSLQHLNSQWYWYLQ
jgi:hypothetical protein